MDIREFLIGCSFSCEHKGFDQLCDCINMCFEDDYKMLFKKNLYIEVAKKYDVSFTLIPENIYYLTKQAWDNGGKWAMERMFQERIWEMPSPGMLISMCVCFLKYGKC